MMVKLESPIVEEFKPDDAIDTWVVIIIQLFNLSHNSTLICMQIYYSLGGPCSEAEKTQIQQKKYERKTGGSRRNDS